MINYQKMLQGGRTAIGDVIVALKPIPRTMQGNILLKALCAYNVYYVYIMCMMYASHNTFQSQPVDYDFDFFF